MTLFYTEDNKKTPRAKAVLMTAIGYCVLCPVWREEPGEDAPQWAVEGYASIHQRPLPKRRMKKRKHSRFV